MMNRAILLARKGEGRVEPNPMVGCVIARKNRIIGEGYHRRFGGPHAEIEALAACREDPRGATVYVSLEPCCHHGKTPPCTAALIQAGIGRVVLAMKDPGPYVSGGGIRQLRKAGITVDIGAGAGDAAELLAPYLTRLRRTRPYVIAKWAQSLDGKLATRTGDSQWISCETSRRKVHRLRGRVDAVLVGSGTVLKDDPLLTARNVRVRRQALRVVLDGRLRIPEKCQLVGTNGSAPTLIFTSRTKAASGKAQRLQRRGVQIDPCRLSRGRLSIADCLGKLAKRDVTNVLVEGGPTVLTSFLETGLVDEAWVFVAPKLIGGKDAPTAFAGLGATRIDTTSVPRAVTTRRSGSDTLFYMRLTNPPGA
jgi:diaminohydroxyphosphoribosylaminopyrimidine deaminase/5-amino-6-(5-phosphoribosylamino)uracil reductase